MDKATAQAVHASAQAAFCDGAAANPLGSGRPELACACCCLPGVANLPFAWASRRGFCATHEMQTLQRRCFCFFQEVFCFPVAFAALLGEPSASIHVF